MKYKFRYYLKHDTNQETAGYIAVDSELDAWEYLEQIKRLDIASLKQLYNIEFHEYNTYEKPNN